MKTCADPLVPLLDELNGNQNKSLLSNGDGVRKMCITYTAYQQCIICESMCVQQIANCAPLAISPPEVNCAPAGPPFMFLEVLTKIMCQADTLDAIDVRRIVRSSVKKLVKTSQANAQCMQLVDADARTRACGEAQAADSTDELSTHCPLLQTMHIFLEVLSHFAHRHCLC